MSQMADLALKEPGIVACLVQGMGAHADVASLLFLFASDMELFSFAQNQQVLPPLLAHALPMSRCRHCQHPAAVGHAGGATHRSRR